MIANKIICACRNLPLGEGSSTYRNLNSIIHDANRLVNCAHDKVQTVSDLRLCVRNHKAVTRKGACLWSGTSAVSFPDGFDSGNETHWRPAYMHVLV